jgi:ATP-dependent helicase HrpA
MQGRILNPPPTTARADAVHRAVLAGLLSNIGHKIEPHEYTGARGIKFNIFPGSSLFRREPQWLMAAELVETTRLYARTVAKIDPVWIERIAEHLLKRTYTDPHWNPHTAHVVAYEKVTLYGLVLIPQRPVHYGPIDPVISRQIFIQNALVLGEFSTDAPFFRQNARLIDDIQRLEAKSRARDVLVSDEARFDFYDARIPAGIFNGPLFEKWRKGIERHNPKLLFMTRRDLMMHGASHVTAEQFPDSMTIGNIRLPLEYHLEVGHVADGVTVTIPLPALTQLPSERFEWLVPGLLKEKLAALIKSLPKDLRVNFVPAPEFADEAARALKPGDGSLLDALATFLSKQKGITVPREAFDPTSLLDHLHMNFKVVDEAGKTLAMGRNLDAIRRQLGVEVKKTFDTIEHPKYYREIVTRWDFGDLPESVPVKRHGMSLSAFPALVDSGDHVSLRLLDSPEAAKLAHAGGLRKLLMNELKDEIRYLGTMLPNMHEMCMHYATLGPCQDLKEDIVAKTINKAFLYDYNVRTAMEYELRKEAGRRHRLLEVGKEVAALAGQVLAQYHQVALLLSKPAIPAWGPTLADIRNQIAWLMPKGFLTNTPDVWLGHFPRFLKGIAARLGKLVTAGHTRDQQNMAEIQPLWQAYLDRLKKNREQRIIDPALETYRWMIEELRVSLFAQELRTSIPVSVKRLEKQWELVRK